MSAINLATWQKPRTSEAKKSAPKKSWKMGIYEQLLGSLLCLQVYQSFSNSLE